MLYRGFRLARLGRSTRGTRRQKDEQREWERGMGRRELNRPPKNSRGIPRRNSGPDSHLPDSRFWTADRVSWLAVCGLLLLAVGLVFGQTVRHEFVNFDDDRYVSTRIRTCTRGLTAEGIVWAFTHQPCRQLASAHLALATCWTASSTVCKPGDIT